MEKEKVYDTLNYFRTNLYISISSYVAWKNLILSRNEPFSGRDLALSNTNSQNLYGNFFIVAEYSFLTCWVIHVLHVLDHNTDALSLRKISHKSVERFLKESNNKKIYEHLKSLRDKTFAHRNKELANEDMLVPPMSELDIFFDNLKELYNNLTLEFDNSSTTFINAENMKHDLNKLLETIRLSL